MKDFWINICGVNVVIVIFLGPPGAGKGTQAKKLSDYFEWRHLSTGDLLRNEVKNETELGLLANEFMKKGDLVPDKIIINMISNILVNQNAGIVLDGFPRTIDQARSLRHSLEDISKKIDKVLFLDVEESKIISRLTNRGRKDDDPKVIVNRLKTYGDLTQPLISFYEKEGLIEKIDGNGTEENVFNNLLKVMA